MKWKAEILLESLSDVSVLDKLDVEQVEELNDDSGTWHVYHVFVEERRIPSISACIKEGPWFIHLWNQEEIIVLFKDAYFKFLCTDSETIEKVREHGKRIHIPEEELQFSPS